MANNPLQQYFRQPKIFVGLPSHGLYNKPGTINGDVSHMPVFGMTGMDEILLKTPDALLTGESTAKVIQSCCPSIIDPWDISLLDLDLLLTAIRIATFGGDLDIIHTCSECGTDNDYTINLTEVIDHFNSCKYNNELVYGDLKITTRPLSYKDSNQFALLNFQMQQQIKQITELEDNEQRKALMDKVLLDMGSLRYDVYARQVESVHIGNTVVTDFVHIKEWIQNADRAVMEAIRKHIEDNKEMWAPPKHKVQCSNCNHEDTTVVELDQTNFFVDA